MPNESTHDPRVVLVRDKYFSLRPKPLEEWLWKQAIPPSAERVFWLHWQEGMRNADWCSAIPIKQVARRCYLDVSTVTRCYQVLIGLGLIRRADPGRDPANPFQQATAITEVRVPRELLVELDRYPNRPQSSTQRPTRPAALPPVASTQAPPIAQTPRRDPFPGLTMKQRMRALGELRSRMSAAEQRSFDEAQRLHTSGMAFEENSQLHAEERATLLLFLEICAVKPAAPPVSLSPPASGAVAGDPRKLTVFELARLRRELLAAVEPAEANERLREVVWSIEEGSLRRFQSLHAMRIALKKIREGAWTRPNRMPPNWARTLSAPRALGRSSAAAQPETCQTA
jgi:hypothetical protein